MNIIITYAHPFFTSDLTNTKIKAHQHVSEDGEIFVSTFVLENANMLIRLINRENDVEEKKEDEEGVMSVSEMEILKKQVRNMFWQDKYCGVDQFVDNHFAW
jgi:hypothetical protein